MYNIDILAKQINYFFNILCAILFQTSVKRAKRFVQPAVFKRLGKLRNKTLDSETFHIYIRKSLKNPKITIACSHFNVFNEIFMIFYFNLMGMSRNVIFKYRETHTGKVLCFGHPNMLLLFLGSFFLNFHQTMSIEPIERRIN